MNSFVRAHIDEIKDTYENLGFKSQSDMLKSIKTDWQTAYWALTELCVWGMKENYLKKFLIEEGDSFNVYCIGGRYLKKYYQKDGIIEVKRITTTIEIIDWEEVK
jgi:hypothetical protein